MFIKCVAMTNYIRRKVDNYLIEWKNNPDKKPLVIRGARQVGKTLSIREFSNNYKSYIEINFVTNPEYKLAFSNGYSVEKIVNGISLINPDFRFLDGETLIFFDEVQEFSDCTTSLKFFKEDGRFDVICSGSMMGLNYKEITSNSVGYKTDYVMYSIDFEEFLWAKGYRQSQIDDIFDHVNTLKPFSDLEMKVYSDLFLEYVIVGGMPEIVSKYISTKMFSGILDMQRQLLLDYETDITKYADNHNKSRIESVYRNISVFLSKENKKFQITKLSPSARTRNYAGCIDWLRDAGIINICYCLNFPELPLKGNYDETKYKIYYHDNGLLIASLDEESNDDLRKNRNLGVYKGAIYENIIAEAFVKQGLPIYYYKKENSQMEIDFLIRNSDSLIPVEVKANDGATKSLNNIIASDSYPDVKFGIKLCNKNIGFNGKFYTIPYFCSFLMKRWLKG